MKLKFILIYYIASGFLFGQGWHEKWDSAGSSWYEKWDRTLDSINEFSDDDKMEVLGSAATIGNKFSREEQMEVYARAVDIMKKTPGHAEYFGRKLAEARSKTNDPWHNYNYNEVFENVLKTLSNIPTPEAVKVLGEMLEDTSDYPNEDQLKEIIRSGGNIDAPSGLAMSALRRINTRDLPDSKSWRDVELWRKWWQEVKSGRKPFSFKGQNVEYRFKPDGTWETLQIANPPDDAVKPPKLTPRLAPEKAPEQDVQPSKPENVTNWWPWLWIPALAIVAVGWRMFSRRGSAQ